MKKILIFMGLIVLLASAICSADEVFVQIRFKEPTEIGVFDGALHYTVAEYARVEFDELQAAKRARAAEWVESVRNAPDGTELTREELGQLINDLDRQKAEYMRMIDVIDALNVEEERTR